jgi:hypothetical protein
MSADDSCLVIHLALAWECKSHPDHLDRLSSPESEGGSWGNTILQYSINHSATLLVTVCRRDHEFEGAYDETIHYSFAINARRGVLN